MNASSEFGKQPRWVSGETPYRRRSTSREAQLRPESTIGPRSLLAVPPCKGGRTCGELWVNPEQQYLALRSINERSCRWALKSILLSRSLGLFGCTESRADRRSLSPTFTLGFELREVATTCSPSNQPLKQSELMKEGACGVVAFAKSVKCVRRLECDWLATRVQVAKRGDVIYKIDKIVALKVNGWAHAHARQV